MRLGLTVHQPERVRRPEVVEQLRAMAPDTMVVVGYGQIIPQAILDIPPRGIVNVHASLLPKYRGAAPIQWAIARGEKITGVTTMKIDAGLDTGAMLKKWETEIGEEETAVELGARLAEAGADLLIRTLEDLPEIVPEPQDNALATLAPILKREDGHIDWKMPAREILNRARGFQPWPGAFGFLRGLRFHVWRGAAADKQLAPGVLLAEGKQLFAGCGGGAIELIEIQMEGKKRMAASAFLNGFSVAAGEVLV
jgi:methionyl-tRNA formyltransferase